LGATAFRDECPLNLFSRLVREHGNIVHVLLGEARMVVLNEPDLIEQVLRRDHAKFVKGSLWWIKAVMGNGVGVSEGQDHRRQRKMMAPHRDGRFFPKPEKFDPDRWLSEAEKSRPKFSYYPFGGGDRICLGQAKAWMEGPLIVANILKKWKVAFVEEPELVAAVVLSAPRMVLDFQLR
jgi:cytochrome P450